MSLGLRQCALLNISVCEATVEASAEGRGFRCVVMSYLPHSVSTEPSEEDMRNGSLMHANGAG